MRRSFARFGLTYQPKLGLRHRQHEAISQMRQVADQYVHRLLIGEAYLPIDRLMAYYGVDLTGFQLPFNFHLISTSWNPAAIAGLIELYEQALPPGGWPNWVLGNHDRSRVATRLGRDQARVAAMLLLTLRGTTTIYQGEELGMQNAAVSPSQVQDPWEKNVPGLGFGRDPVRSPMPWSRDRHGGFTTAEPWLPVLPRELLPASGSATIQPRCFRSINPCCDCAAPSRPSPSGRIRAWHIQRPSWCTSASMSGGNFGSL
jgi:glycosidase